MHTKSHSQQLVIIYFNQLWHPFYTTALKYFYQQVKYISTEIKTATAQPLQH